MISRAKASTFTPQISFTASLPLHFGPCKMRKFSYGEITPPYCTQRYSSWRRLNPHILVLLECRYSLLCKDTVTSSHLATIHCVILSQVQRAEPATDRNISRIQSWQHGVLSLRCLLFNLNANHETFWRTWI